MWASCYYRPENETLYRSNTNWNRSIVFWYKDKKIKCKISFHSTKGIPILWCKDKYKRMLPMAIYHSICEIFSISPIIQIKFDMSRLSEFPDTNEIDNVITGCRDKDQIEEFLKNVIIRNATQLWLGSCQLSVDSVILSLEHALFWSPKWLIKEHLISFRGQTALFVDPRTIGTDDLIDFILHWQQGKNMKLESLVIILNDYEPLKFDKEKVFEKLDANPWNPERRAGRFKKSTA
ncbi:hypothetical protein GCK72_006889 [Caenorhabditis remanei]|uniref:Uncharacterized protein n=1 Tax=Caenorhabditis remanei TaxID=31234 RepID=A0A6A5HIH0_CAERE|nr:hypothetical protein GCK72_006889 [Caenorhabditis remanei]KAF1766931.1 hypothetical protein GCK72_006889 [Caenorhabditis remanei]